jgi:hypothetical protein
LFLVYNFPAADLHFSICSIAFANLLAAIPLMTVDAAPLAAPTPAVMAFVVDWILLKSALVSPPFAAKAAARVFVLFSFPCML